ncbi:hypothetical protein PR202_ga23769 [Eleusine coracana subsp. coracana]|uniref:Secreted protein n=1 Tax=Eleusine coracana subsp. coracana TaxID=191504 RepID=A0AAV5D762_ELECO|nr:hypothetical protein PR202_ga23769 [Eleusine coracana subsp. coracana]
MCVAAASAIAASGTTRGAGGGLGSSARCAPTRKPAAGSAARERYRRRGLGLGSPGGVERPCGARRLFPSAQGKANSLSAHRPQFLQ